jgi:hypothetical protein
MKRTKRYTLRRIALGLAVAAVVAPAAQAEPIGSYERQSQSSVEIPYLSGGVGVSHMDFDPASKASGRQSNEIAYLSHGKTVADSGIALGPDDVTMSRPTNLGSPSVASSSSWDVGSGTVSGFALALVLLAGGSALVIRHNRRTRLSPA